MTSQPVLTIPQRDFGQTGLKVSAIGLGAGQVGSSRLSEKEAETLLHTALDAGITLIDTARGYGLSEERIGRFLSGRRSEFVLSTKVGYDVPGLSDWTYDSVTGGIERALRVMNTDHLDIVHLHSCGLDVLREGSVIRALEAARQSGKIRFAAYSGENEALEYAIQCGQFQSIQLSVNLCDQHSIAAYLPQADQLGLGVIAKRPMGNYFWRFEDRPVGDYAEEYWLRAQIMRLDPQKMAGIGDWAEFALRFSAFTPGVHVCIIGTSSASHLQENLKLLSKGPLPENAYQAVRQAFLTNAKTAASGWAGQI